MFYMAFGINSDYFLKQYWQTFLQWRNYELTLKNIIFTLTHCGRGHLNFLNARYRGF